MASKKNHAVVIGAGIGGLSAAIRLASGGWRVSLFEQIDRPGGKMSEVHDEGFRWDTGPSVITMRHVFERLFSLAGRRLSDYLDLVPLNPITRYFWRDGLRLDASSDEQAMCEQIAQFSPRDVDGYRRFMRYVKRLHDIIAEPFLYRQQPTLRDLLHLPLAQVLKIDAMRTMHRAIRAYFHDPHLIQLFDRFATYNGSSPYLAPATLNVIAFVEMAQGAWYPRGGVYEIARAMHTLAQELGVESHFNCGVGQILLKNGSAAGVRLRDGRNVPADKIICNADVSWARKTLLPPNDNRSKWAQTLQKWRTRQMLEPSCSGLAMLFKAHSTTPDLAHHNLFFNDPADYAGEFEQIFAQNVPPSHPTFYVCITSKTDPHHAPPNCENWFVLVNVPYLSPKFDWQTHGEGYIQSASRQLEDWRSAVTDVPATAMPKPHRVISPLSLQNVYGGNRGSIYGFSSNSRTAAFLRPANRAPDIANLHFVGGSAHPGGGVPLVTLSGMTVAP